MNQKFRAKDKAVAQLTANTDIKAGFKIGGYFTIECKDSDGNVKWVDKAHNLFTDEGLDDILDIVFSDGGQDATHYVGLKGAGAVLAADDLTTQANWTEFTDYTGTRQIWVEAGVTSQTITNTASPAVFPITGAGTVAGAFITNVTSGTAGILFCAVDFTSSRTVGSGDTLNVVYELSAADDGV